MPWTKKPSPPPRVFHQCLRKAAYPHAKQAENVAKKMAANGKPVEAYKCPLCGHYHVGRKRKERL